MPVTRLARVGLTVADLPVATAFFRDGLGFRPVGSELREGPAFAALTGLEGARAEVAVLELGGREIELARFTPPGRAYPPARAADDPWFQHFAVVVADMPAAYAELRRRAQRPISDGGPQLLPPSTGSVTAYKFRDPEGHPLELSHIPGGAWAEAGTQRPGAVFLGLDHTAVAVADVDASLAFYVDLLGLVEAGRGVNAGPTQERLDGLPGATLDIVVVGPAAAPEPHVELLAYRTPRSPRAPVDFGPADVPATRMMLEVDDLTALAGRLAEAGARFVSAGVVDMGDGARRALVRDPDGHLLELVQPARRRAP